MVEATGLLVQPKLVEKSSQSRGARGASMDTRRLLRVCIERWTDDGERIVEHAAGVLEDFSRSAMATYHAALQRWPKAACMQDHAGDRQPAHAIGILFVSAVEGREGGVESDERTKRRRSSTRSRPPKSSLPAIRTGTPRKWPCDVRT